MLSFAIGVALLAAGQTPGQPRDVPAQQPSVEARPRLAAEPQKDKVFDTLFKASTEGERPRFRVSVEAVRRWTLEHPWDEDRAVPGYVQPYYTLYHHEFLAQVTPEEVRGGVLYPIGVPVLSLTRALDRKLRKMSAARAERRARSRVEQELREYFEK